MLDADVEGADWREVARIVLQSTRTANLIERGRLSRAHLAHAKWMTSLACMNVRAISNVRISL
jgi:hypothetical protein